MSGRIPFGTGTEPAFINPNFAGGPFTMRTTEKKTKADAVRKALRAWAADAVKNAPTLAEIQHIVKSATDIEEAFSKADADAERRREVLTSEADE